MSDRPTPNAGPRLFLSVAETSADIYAAGLIEAVMQRQPGASFFGLTGPRARDAGAETFHDLTAKSAMLLGAVARVPEAMWMMHRLKKSLAAAPPDAAVLIDSPAINLRIAAVCQRLGIPVLYYVAPQTWAWAEGRVEKMRRLIARLAVILPFEEAYFAGHGIPAKFVGHPLFERLERTTPDERRIAALRQRGQPLIALLPGSRRQVIHEVFPGQLEVAAAISREYREAFFLVVAADAMAEDTARAIATRVTRAGLALSLDRLLFDCRCRDEMLLAADMALVASGTATLEVAYRATPMIVMYNHGRWLLPVANAVLGLMGKQLLRTKYLCLPNILAQRELVPEFMPYYASTAPIAEKALELLASPRRRAEQEAGLAELVAPMVRNDVSATVAEELLGLCARREIRA